MNIKKKISFFALFLISSFFIVGEVKGYEDYGYYGGGNDSSFVRLKEVAGSSWEFSETGIGFRVTFTNETGAKISGSKIVDYYPKGTKEGFLPSDNTTTGKYKFSTSKENIKVIKHFNFDISYCKDSLNNLNSLKCNEELIKNWKNKVPDNTFMKTLLSNAGITNPPNTVYIVLEKLYKIIVVTKNRSLCGTTRCEVFKETKCKDEVKKLYGTFNTTAFDECTRAMQIYNINDTLTSYRGTASEIAEIIFTKSSTNDDVKENLLKSPDMKNELGTGFDIETTNGFYQLTSKTDGGFTRENFNPAKPESELEWSDIYDNSYANGLYIIKASVSNGCNTKTDAERLGRDWDFSSNTCCKEGTYYKHAVGYKKNGACCLNSTDEYDKLSQRCVTKGTCTKDNHNRLNKDWNSKKNVCCNVGELFNGTDCTTKAAPTVSGIKTVYNFTTINSINTCTSNGVNSLISNFVKKSASKTQNGKNVQINPKEADFLLYNNKYKVIFNKETLYCNETLETQFDGFTKNFGNLFSGKFISLKELPTISKTVSCYIVDPNAGTSNGKASVGASYVNKVSAIGINFNFLGGKYNYNYLFKNPTATTPDGVKTEVGTTSYNVKYTKFSATINYQFSEISINNKSVENKNINILTAKNLNSISTIMQENKTYKTIDSLSIQIPTNIPTGTYTNSISLTNLDNALEKIKNQDPSHYSFAKSNPNGNCIFKYTIKGTDIDNCGEKYRSAIKTPISVSFGVSYTGKFDSKTKECNFTITLSSSSSNLMTQDLCKSYKTLPGVSGIPQVSFNSASNTTEIYFKNESVNGDPTKSCKFNINIKDYELVFRPISLSDPFPGSNGKGRTPNSKVWDTDKIDTYIKNRQDAYTKKPLYSVTLTPSQIINIRKYNKTHKYDDFNLKCVGFKLVNGKLTETGKACYSGFIRTYLNTNKSVCANTNNQSEKSFNSCADYSKRQ